MRNLFTGQTEQDAFPPSDGLTNGASELQAGLTARKYIVSCMLPPGASIQMYKSRANDNPFDFLPFGSALTETQHVPVTLSEKYVVIFVLSGADPGVAAELYLRDAPDSLIFENEAQVGVGVA